MNQFKIFLINKIIVCAPFEKKKYPFLEQHYLFEKFPPVFSRVNTRFIYQSIDYAKIIDMQISIVYCTSFSCDLFYRIFSNNRSEFITNMVL